MSAHGCPSHPASNPQITHVSPVSERSSPPSRGGRVRGCRSSPGGWSCPLGGIRCPGAGVLVLRRHRLHGIPSVSVRGFPGGGRGASPGGGETAGASRVRVSGVFLEVLQAVAVYHVVAPAWGAPRPCPAARVPGASPRDAVGALDFIPAGHACIAVLSAPRISRGSRSVLGDRWARLRGVRRPGRPAVRVAIAAGVCAAPFVVAASVPAGKGPVAGSEAFFRSTVRAPGRPRVASLLYPAGGAENSACGWGVLEELEVALQVQQVSTLRGPSLGGSPR